jgi:hypothetical protein
MCPYVISINPLSMERQMSTFSEARRLGAPAILTDGKARFKISDWDNSGRAVYGRPVDARGEYQKLPEGLTGEAK